jgi:hypothetical protein
MKKAVANPDPEVGYSGTVHSVVLYRSATPDLQIRIHHKRKMGIDVERITVQLLILWVALLQQKLLLETAFIAIDGLLLCLHC